MGFIDRARSILGMPPAEKKLINAYDLALDLLNGAASASGVKVTRETILQASTALACARLIGEGLAQVPLVLMRKRAGGGADPATDHPLYDCLHARANDWTTSFELRETIGLQVAIGYSAVMLVTRVGNARAGRVMLHSVPPSRVRIETGITTEPRYWFQDDKGRETPLDPARVLHIRGPSYDGAQTLDGVRLAREAVGLALAAEQHGSRVFSNGGAMGGILSTDQAMLDKTQRDALREAWREQSEGLQNAYRAVVLWAGMKFTPRTQSNDQAQWIEVRRFQVAEVCRQMRVLPIMVGEADKTASYASVEQMMLAHIVHTMGPYYQRVEQRLNMQLLTEAERAAGYYTKFRMQGLLRGAHRDRAEFYRVMHGVGAFSPNDILGLEDMNPFDGGDERIRPMNMVAVGSPPDAGSGGGGGSDSGGGGN